MAYLSLGSLSLEPGWPDSLGSCSEPQILWLPLESSYITARETGVGWGRRVASSWSCHRVFHAPQAPGPRWGPTFAWRSLPGPPLGRAAMAISRRAEGPGPALMLSPSLGSGQYSWRAATLVFSVSGKGPCQQPPGRLLPHPNI